MTTIINHFSLNPADPGTRRMLRVEMEHFFFSGETAHAASNLSPETVRKA